MDDNSRFESKIPGQSSSITIRNDGVVAGSRQPNWIAATRTFFDSCERFALRHPLSYSFLLMAAVFVVTILFARPFYETNDDAVMSMIASGTGIGTTPDEHIVFTNFTIGLLLKKLYLAFPNVPWYGSYLILVHYLASVAATHSILTYRYRRELAYCFLLLIATVGVHMLIRLQFTCIAMWATECGILTLLAAFGRRRDDPSQHSWGMIFSGALLMIIGSMVRFEPFIVAIAASALPCTLLIWQLEREVEPRRRTWKLGLVVGCVTLGVVGGLAMANNRYYDADAGWREFFIYNPYRVKFNDYQWTSFNVETKPIFDSVQWTENDFEMISKWWYFDDDRIYSRANLQSIVDGYPWAKSKVHNNTFGLWWWRVLQDRMLWAVWLQLPLHVWFARNPKKTILNLVVTAISIDAIMCGLMILKEPVFRMYFPLFALQAVLSLNFMRLGEPAQLLNLSNIPFGIWIWWEGKSARNRIGFDVILKPPVLGALAIALACLGTSISVYQAKRLSHKSVAANKRLRSELKQIDPKGDELYVCWGGSFPYEVILPLESPQRYRDLHLLCLGWTQKSPINYAVKDSFQIHDLALDLIEKENVYLVSNELLNKYYEIFLQEHYDRDLDWDVRYFSKTLQVWKPVPKTASAADDDSDDRHNEPGQLEDVMNASSISDDTEWVNDADDKMKDDFKKSAKRSVVPASAEREVLIRDQDDSPTSIR